MSEPYDATRAAAEPVRRFNPELYDAARAAAESVRRFNHDSLNAPSMTAPEIHRSMVALTDLVDRLPQAFDQLAAHLAKQLAAGNVRMEDGRDPAEPVQTVITALRKASSLASPKNRTDFGDPAGAFGEAVHEASGWLFNMGAPWEADQSDD